MKDQQDTSVDVLDRTLDADAHEMTPSHLWGDVFGEAAGRIAELAAPMLQKAGGNDYHNPAVSHDSEPINHENVWNIRGVRAPGAFDISRRLEVMDVMGVRRQLLFPSYAIFANHFLTGNDEVIRGQYGIDLPEDEVRQLGLDGLSEYNEWAIRSTKIDPDRIRAVAYVHAGTDVDDLYTRTKDLLDRGVRAIHLPSSVPPGGHSPAHEDLDRFWAMLAEADIPFVMHVGSEFSLFRSSEWVRAAAFKPGKVESHELGLEPYSMSTLHMAAANYLTCMILGGVFERHPALRVGAVELGAGWLGPLADNLDMWARDVYKVRLSPFISMLPSEYMARNIRVTPFNNFEPIESYFTAYPRLVDCYCYSTDYPHIEGGTDIKRKFFDRVSPLGETIVEKFFAKNAELVLPV